MVHVLVLEAAHHLDDRVDLADVGQKLVAEPLALARPLDQPGDVDELDRRRDHHVGLGDPCSTSSRASGTVTMPTLGSMVQNG